MLGQTQTYTRGGGGGGGPQSRKIDQIVAKCSNNVGLHFDVHVNNINLIIN